MRRGNAAAMNGHLLEISAKVAQDAHAVLLLDQAGWHIAGDLNVPANIILIPLPPKCPELNPVENGWQFMRQNWPSNRIAKSYNTSSITTSMPGRNSPSSRGGSCPLSCECRPIRIDQTALG